MITTESSKDSKRSIRRSRSRRCWARAISLPPGFSPNGAAKNICLMSSAPAPIRSTTRFYKAHVLEPIKPALLLPEVQDQSKWFEGEHRYIDPERRYIFAFVANSQSGQVIYNLKQVSPGEFKSYWDLVDPKWKGKMASLDPTSFGMGATLQFFYFPPELGPPFL